MNQTWALGTFMYGCVHARQGEMNGRESLDSGCAIDVWAKTAHLYTNMQVHIGTNTTVHSAKQTQAHKHTQIFHSTRLLSVAFLSLPLAVSQIPDDVLTGGRSDWRYGCVMTDLGLYQWPAHCQLAVWRLTGRLKPKTFSFKPLSSLAAGALWV